MMDKTTDILSLIHPFSKFCVHTSLWKFFGPGMERKLDLAKPTDQTLVCLCLEVGGQLNTLVIEHHDNTCTVGISTKQWLHIHSFLISKLSKGHIHSSQPPTEQLFDEEQIKQYPSNADILKCIISITYCI